ncbi:hypothetical protein J0A68_15535 [Algoriphagus sp. H41]|uniref:Uncharacterized protein n=1 Tax=Algoriphagus oliviformis TaxID=2811231 RepID=A0ABS3C889_9BACT|nr:hypothetical protein [Algoriphagus oliviformis]MBN7812365.1 hypothetical protein [Algoriphagus oliviformis]
MEVKTAQASLLDLPEEVLKDFFCKELAASFQPSIPQSSLCRHDGKPTLLTADLMNALTWLSRQDLQKAVDSDNCDVPVLLFASEFSTNHLLFHYDGSSGSSELIQRFVSLFGNLIQHSKATIISPSFIPKSKIREEQEVIQLVSSSIRETSFIKFNFNRLGDFLAYGVKQNCTLLVTNKSCQTDLVKVLSQFYSGRKSTGRLSYYLSL